MAGEANKQAILITMQTMFGEDMVVIEHRFHSVRRWRFDYAIPKIKLAVEYHGNAAFVGKFGSSGHGSIKGQTNDCEKINSAIALGWLVLQFTALHFRHSDRFKHNLTDVRTTIMNALASMQTDKEKNNK